MNEFRKAFRETVEALTDEMVIPGTLQTLEDRDIYSLPKQCDKGFEVQLECMDYGVYPTVEGWHGGCWDVTVFETSDLRTSIKEFILSMLHNAILEVRSSGNKPYKWVLHYNFEGELVKDETGLLFYNWFGQRTTKEYTNTQVAT